MMKRPRNEVVAPDGARVLCPTLRAAVVAVRNWYVLPAMVRSLTTPPEALEPGPASSSADAVDGRRLVAPVQA